MLVVLYLNLHRLSYVVNDKRVKRVKIELNAWQPFSRGVDPWNQAV